MFCCKYSLKSAQPYLEQLKIPWWDSFFSFGGWWFLEVLSIDCSVFRMGYANSAPPRQQRFQAMSPSRAICFRVTKALFRMASLVLVSDGFSMLLFLRYQGWLYQQSERVKLSLQLFDVWVEVSSTIWNVFGSGKTEEMRTVSRSFNERFLLSCKKLTRHNQFIPKRSDCGEASKNKAPGTNRFSP